MPVPKNKRKKFSTIVAAQTTRLEKKGENPSQANQEAKGMADEAISKPSFNERRRKRRG